MMKRLGILFACLCCALAMQAQTPTGIQWTWTLPSQNSKLVACSTTVTSSCLLGETLTDVTVSASPVVVATYPTLGPTTTTYTQTPLPPSTPATRNYTIVINYKDGSGATQATSIGTCGSAGTAGPCAFNVPFVVYPVQNLTGTAN